MGFQSAGGGPTTKGNLTIVGCMVDVMRIDRLKSYYFEQGNGAECDDVCGMRDDIFLQDERS